MTYYCILLIALPATVAAISCLVVRPGHGLISEPCPTTSIGCRIRVLSDRIGWYDWARLYDRNQLVCVFPEEYPVESGCQRIGPRKVVRCWCGGSDNCNDALNSKRIYEEFIGPTTTTTKATTTTTTTTTTRRPLTTTRRPTTTHRVTTTRRPTKEAVTPFFISSRRVVKVTTAVKNEKARILPTDAIDTSFHDEFEAARERLEAEMREEDERIQAVLQDEEREMRADDEDRIERRRRLEEERRLEEMDREEEQLRRAERQPDEYDDDDEEDDEDDDENSEYGGFGYSSQTSTTMSLVAMVVPLLIRLQ